MPAIPKIVIPSILENSFEQFASRLKAIEQVAPLVEIDVMDGIFVDSQSFTDIEKINELNTPVKFQLPFPSRLCILPNHHGRVRRMLMRRLAMRFAEHNKQQSRCLFQYICCLCKKQEFYRPQSFCPPRDCNKSKLN